MPLKLDEVDSAIDFPNLIACEWDSYENPDQKVFRLFCSPPWTGPTSRANAIKECTARQLEWHRSDPTSYWQKVTDTETRMIVAGGLWKSARQIHSLIQRT